MRKEKKNRKKKNCEMKIDDEMIHWDKRRNQNEDFIRIISIYS